MQTEREAYALLIHLANTAGRDGKKVYVYGVMLPPTASGEYAVFLDARYPATASESW
jgi:hypothetical protein